MKFTHLEFRQKLLEHRFKRLLEAIEPELNSFGRIMDLFLTAGGELRESSLSVISRAINQKKQLEIRGLGLQINELQREQDSKDREITVAKENLENATTDSEKQNYRDVIKQLRREIEDLKHQIRFLRRDVTEKQKVMLSDVAQNAVFRAAFNRLSQCAEDLGYPTAKNGFAGAVFGSNFAQAMSALGKPTASGVAAGPSPTPGPGPQTPPNTPQKGAKYLPSPVPTGPKTPVQGQVQQKPAAPAKPQQQAAPAPTPAAPAPTPTPAAKPTQSKPASISKPVVTKPQPTVQAQPTPAATSQPDTSNFGVFQRQTPAPTQAPAPAASQPKTPAAATTPLPGLVGDHLGIQNLLKTNEARDYFKVAYDWVDKFSGIVDGFSGSQVDRWLYGELSKIITEELKNGILRADAAWSKPEYRSTLPQDLFNADAFKSNPVKRTFSDQIDKMLSQSSAAVFGSAKLDVWAMRFNAVFAKDLWPTLSSEMNRLAGESSKFVSPQDVQAVVDVVKSVEQEGGSLEEALTPVAEQLGLSSDAVSGVALLLSNSFDPDIQEQPEEVAEPEIEPAQEPSAIPGPEPQAPAEPEVQGRELSYSDFEEFLLKTKLGDDVSVFAPLVQMFVASLDPEVLDNAARKADQKFNIILGHFRTGETSDEAEQAQVLLRKKRKEFEGLVLKAVEARRSGKSIAAPQNAPETAPSAPSSLSAVISQGMQALEALKTADANSLRSMSGNLTPAEVQQGTSQMLSALKSGGMPALLKYLSQL